MGILTIFKRWAHEIARHIRLESVVEHNGKGGTRTTDRYADGRVVVTECNWHGNHDLSITESHAFLDPTKEKDTFTSLIEQMAKSGVYRRPVKTTPPDVKTIPWREAKFSAELSRMRAIDDDIVRMYPHTIRAIEHTEAIRGSGENIDFASQYPKEEDSLDVGGRNLKERSQRFVDRCREMCIKNPQHIILKNTNWLHTDPRLSSCRALVVSGPRIDHDAFEPAALKINLRSPYADPQSLYYERLKMAKIFEKLVWPKRKRPAGIGRGLTTPMFWWPVEDIDPFFSFLPYEKIQEGIAEKYKQIFVDLKEKAIDDVVSRIDKEYTEYHEVEDWRKEFPTLEEKIRKTVSLLNRSVDLTQTYSDGCLSLIYRNCIGFNNRDCLIVSVDFESDVICAYARKEKKDYEFPFDGPIPEEVETILTRFSPLSIYYYNRKEK